MPGLIITPRRHISRSVAYFNSHLRDHGAEEQTVSYICRQMAWLFPDLERTAPGSGHFAGRALRESEIPQVLARLAALPDAADYGFKS